MNTNNTWKGYTLQELRIRRVVTEARIEIERGRLYSNSKNLKKRTVSMPFASPLFKKVMGALDYADYMVLAFSIGRRLTKLLRRKKK